MEPDVLSAEEVASLDRCEVIIESRIAAFVEVGDALREILERRLYRAYGSFDAYCRDRWGLSRQRAYEVIGLARVVSHLTGIPDKKCRKSHLSPLIPLPPDQQRVVWEEAQATAPNGRLTAAHVKSVIDRIQGDGPSCPVPEVGESVGAGPDETHHDGDDAGSTGPDEGPVDPPDSLPIRSQLADATRAIFDSDVALFRAARRVIDAFAEDLRALLKVHDRRGAYHHDLLHLLAVRHPKYWVACPDEEFGGCAGTGLRAGIRCHVCNGRGYLKHAIASQKQMAFLRRKGVVDVAGLNPGEAARRIGALIGGP